jgi:DNA topoisomerase-1
MASAGNTGAPAAAEAGLRWTTDAEGGITRRRCGRGFSYRDASGALVRDRATLDRIRSLAVPPAWRDVWISTDPRGHLQATGRDARGRKQYRYHPAFRARRERVKYDRLATFAACLPRIRAAVDADLALPGVPRRKVLALVVRLLELTLIRVGNDEYARLNRSFGLTTLRDRHARIDGARLRFTFRGKGGRRHEVTVRDRRVARIVARCQELPGQELLQYVEADGTVRAVRSEDVNAYLREVAGTDVTAKDFRTWAATVLAYQALQTAPQAGDDASARRAVAAAVRGAADVLGNTPAVARRSYVHPAVVETFLDGRLPRPSSAQEAAGRGEPALVDPGAPGPAPTSRQAEEELIRLLRRERERQARQDRAASQGRRRTTRRRT